MEPGHHRDDQDQEQENRTGLIREADTPRLGDAESGAKDVKGRLCLGEFYRLNGFDDFYEFDVNEDEKGGLGSFASLFPGKETPRAAFYSSIIADPAAARADKAYALYRAVRCYAPAGYNTCGGDDVEESQRKAWFNTLKRQYADTKWSKELEYYW